MAASLELASNHRDRSLSYKGHTANALALASDEGRGRLRKAPGSCLANFDPEMSEWGNPLCGNMQYWALNT
jgi:hypothetical protein